MSSSTEAQQQQQQQQSMEEQHLVPCSTHDYLESDPPIRGQKYVCVSFISPEDVIVKREAFEFTRFMAHIGADVANMFDRLREKFRDDPTVQETVALLTERHGYMWSPEEMHRELAQYKARNADKLNEDYRLEHGFQTNIRGIKIRGCFEGLDETRQRAQDMHRKEPGCNTFVGEVGCWLPLSPNPDEIKDAVYAETQLNTLVKGYNENAAKSEEFFQARKGDKMRQVQMHASEEEEKLRLIRGSQPEGVKMEFVGLTEEGTQVPLSDAEMAKAMANGASISAAPQQTSDSPGDASGASTSATQTATVSEVSEAITGPDVPRTQ